MEAYKKVMTYTITPRKLYSHLFLGTTLALVVVICIAQHGFSWTPLSLLLFPLVFYLIDKQRDKAKIEVDDEKVVFCNCASMLKEENQRIDRLCIERSQIASCRTTHQLRYTIGGWDMTMHSGEHIYVDYYSMLGRGTSWLRKLLNGDSTASPPSWDWQPHIIFTCLFVVIPILALVVNS